jgi:hypothetical protein
MADSVAALLEAPPPPSGGDTDIIAVFIEKEHKLFDKLRTLAVVGMFHFDQSMLLGLVLVPTVQWFGSFKSREKGIVRTSNVARAG